MHMETRVTLTMGRPLQKEQNRCFTQGGPMCLPCPDRQTTAVQKPLKPGAGRRVFLACRGASARAADSLGLSMKGAAKKNFSPPTGAADEKPIVAASPA